MLFPHLLTKIENMLKRQQPDQRADNIKNTSKSIYLIFFFFLIIFLSIKQWKPGPLKNGNMLYKFMSTMKTKKFS